MQLAYRIESNGADVGGLGIQSHLVGTPDINSIKVIGYILVDTLITRKPDQRATLL